MKRNITVCLGIGAVALFVSLSAKAQTYIINENFDPALSAGAAFSSYSGGDETSGSSGIVTGVGTAGTSAWQISLTTTTGGTAGYANFAGQYQNGGVTGNTSANLSDYTLSFDAESTGGSLNLQVQSWTGASFGGSMTGTLNTAPASPGYGNDLTLSSTYTHYSLNLGNTSIFQGNTGFLPNGGTWQIAFQLNGPGSASGGYTYTMNVDNLQVTMVPEPTSLALCGFGLLGGLLALRRRNS